MLITNLKEQAGQIQKVSARFETSKSARQMVADNQ